MQPINYKVSVRHSQFQGPPSIVINSAVVLHWSTIFNHRTLYLNRDRAPKTVSRGSRISLSGDHCIRLWETKERIGFGVYDDEVVLTKNVC